MDNQIETIGIKEVAGILHKSVASVQKDVTRNPEALPPRLNIPGNRRVLWLKTDVIEWLQSKRTVRAAIGRPRRRHSDKS